MVKAYVTLPALHKQALALIAQPVRLALAVKEYLPRHVPALNWVSGWWLVPAV